MSVNDNSSKRLRRERIGWICCIIVTAFFMSAIGYEISNDEKTTLSNNFADKEQMSSGELNSISTTVKPYNDKCIWGSNGNACLSAGTWLDWCMSTPSNNVTSNLLDFCTYLMTGNNRGSLKPLPFTETWNQTGHYYLINETFVPSKIVDSIEKELSK